MTELTSGEHFIIFVILQHSPLFTKFLSTKLIMAVKLQVRVGSWSHMHGH